MKRHEIFILAGLAASAAVLSGDVTSLEYGATYDCTPEDYRLKVFGCTGPADGDLCDVQAFNRAKPGPRGRSTRKEVLIVLRFCRIQTAAMAKADADGSAITLPRAALRPPAEAPLNTAANNQKSATAPAAAAPRPFTCRSGQNGLCEVSSGVYRNANGDVFDANRNTFTLTNGETGQLISPELVAAAKSAGMTMAEVGGKVACATQDLADKDAADKRAGTLSKGGTAGGTAKDTGQQAAAKAPVSPGAALRPFPCPSGQNGLYEVSRGVYKNLAGDVFDTNRNTITHANGESDELVEAETAAAAKAAGVSLSEAGTGVACITMDVHNERAGAKPQGGATKDTAQQPPSKGNPKGAAVPAGRPFGCPPGQDGVSIVSPGVYRSSGGDIFDANRNTYTLTTGQTGELIDANLAAKAKAEGLTTSELAGQVACSFQGSENKGRPK
jgi:hypothetical protein